MKHTINLFVVSFRDLYIKHSQLQGKFLYDEKIDNISMEILKMAIYSIVPQKERGRTENLLEKIEDILVSDFIEEIKEIPGTIKISAYNKPEGYDSESQQELLNKAWGLYQFTYMMKKLGNIEKNKFLWVAILFPYIYNLNKNWAGKPKNQTQKKIKETVIDLLKQYPIVDNLHGEEALLELKKLNDKEVSYFVDILKRGADIGCEMKEAAFYEMASECKNGVSVVSRISNRKRCTNGKKK